MIADEAVAVREHEGKTDGVEENAAKTGVHYAFHEHVDGFTGTTEAGFQHGEADLHAEHQEGGDQRPGGVYRVDHVGSFDLRRARLGIHVSKEGRRDDCHDRQHQADAQHFAGQQRPSIAAPFRVPQSNRQPRQLLGQR